MAKRGRKPNQEVATLWDYRRGKLLLDVLAMDSNVIERWNAIKQLCENWGVPIVMHELGHAPTEMGTIQALAKHCLEHGRNEGIE